jgi:hypothetical protein
MIQAESAKRTIRCGAESTGISVIIYYLRLGVLILSTYYQIEDKDTCCLLALIYTQVDYVKSPTSRCAYSSAQPNPSMQKLTSKKDPWLGMHVWSMEGRGIAGLP